MGKFGQIESYLGNPKLRRAFINISMSQHEVDEYRKCMEDPIYFTKTYIKIVAPSKGIVPFLLYPFQEDLINHMMKNRFIICKCPRQSGKTVTTVAYMLHCILFTKNYSIAVAAHKGPAANLVLQRLKLAYENLPRWLQCGIIEWNKGNIELDNGSKIAAFATSADGLRSGSYDLVMLDEFSFVRKNIAEEFFTSTYPVITAGDKTKIFIISTPKGMNHFYTAWMKAINKQSEYIPLEYHWTEVPGRDERFKEETIRNTSLEQWNQEYGGEFLGSSHTLICPTKLKQLLATSVYPKTKDGDMDIFDIPVPKHTYCITVDVAEGQQRDYSSFSVIDVTELPYVQVAKYRNNEITPFVFPTVIYQAAKKYNEAFVLVEINTIGLQVADILHFELAYENLIKIELKGKQGQQHTPGFKKKIAFGLKHNKQTKAIGCANLRTLIESDKLKIYDMDTTLEFTTFIAENNTYKAEEGSHDDLAMTLVNFGWLTSQRFFKESINNNIRELLQKEQLKVMDSDIVPFGIIDNGLDDDLLEKGELWVADRERPYVFDNLDFDTLRNKHKL
jgi:hypothetical protein